MSPAPAIKRLLAQQPAVVTLGVLLFTTSLEAQGVRVQHVDWTPAAGGDRAMLDLLADLL
jgi:hypothetical protein